MNLCVNTKCKYYNIGEELNCDGYGSMDIADCVGYMPEGGEAQATSTDAKPEPDTSATKLIALKHRLRALYHNGQSSAHLARHDAYLIVDDKSDEKTALLRESLFREAIAYETAAGWIDAAIKDLR